MHWSFRRTRRLCLVPGLCTVAGLVAPTLLSAAALAAGPKPPLVISSDQSLDGDIGLYESFTVKAGATVSVTPYAGATSAHPGYLQIQANTITIEKGASITADGAGYPGVAGMSGLCDPMMSCAGAGTMTGYPGGGGGYFGPGADGTTEMDAGTCVDLLSGSLGGAGFSPKIAVLGVPLGSAGGASNLGPGMTAATTGGSGGGGIRLFAGKIVLDGTLSANGAKSSEFSGAAPGGGSGGTILVVAGSLTGTGTFSVVGGDGAVGPGVPLTFPANNGGGGSGGVVLLDLPPGATTSSFTFALGGGKTGDCPSSLNGSPGTETTSALPKGATCVDVDKDGYTSVACGGTDCDDVDSTVHPGVTETCNGKDDDCDGKIDETPNDCTPQGLICVNASCVPPPPDAGPDAAPPIDGGGPKPDSIDLTGGCTLPEGLPEQGGAVLAIGVAAMALAASRRRRTKK